MATKITLRTERKTQVLNVTLALASLVQGVGKGLAHFYIPHTTAALLICEDDEDLRRDLERTAESWLSWLKPFSHCRRGNANAEAHILSAFAGTSVTVPVEAGRLELGTYQNVLLLEMDGPKERTVRCEVIVAKEANSEDTHR
jgi:secondary thiamine-phosphate synthase enzyme